MYILQIRNTFCHFSKQKLDCSHAEGKSKAAPGFLAFEVSHYFVSNAQGEAHPALG